MEGDSAVTVGLGSIGAGMMGSIHAQAAVDCPGARLIAVAGGTRAEGLAAQHGVDFEASNDALLARKDVDAVIIATPHTTHLSLTRAAAAAGKHVFIEKPMALDVAECDEMLEACRSAGVRLAVAHITRFLGASQAAHELVQSGEIGEVRMVHAYRLVGGYENSGWPLDPREGTSFLDWGVHGCDIVHWFVGRSPTLVFARATSFGGGIANQSVMAEFAFPGDVMAGVWQSYEMPGLALGARARYLVVGSTGSIELNAYGQTTLGRPDSSRIVYQQPDYDGPNYLMDPERPYWRDGFRNQLQAFVDGLRDGSDVGVSGDEGRAAVEMVQAAERSAVTGQAVRIPL